MNPILEGKVFSPLGSPVDLETLIERALELDEAGLDPALALNSCSKGAAIPPPVQSQRAMRWVRHGVTREVFLTKRLAIKIPKLTSGWRCFLRGLLGNMQEAEFSRTSWPELCPVKFAIPGGWLLVMRRARPLTNAEWEALDVEAFRETEDYHVPVEAKRCSFGVLDGRVVAVDYGS